MRLLVIIIFLTCFASCADKTQKIRHEKSFKTFAQKTHTVDSSFLPAVKLNNIIICGSTISDLKKLGYQPELTQKGQVDSLIIAANWDEGDYYIDKSKNLAFGTYINSELLSSIFVKNNFSGSLKGLRITDFAKLTVRDITTHFKDLNWSTSEVSDYWTYGNDTVNFYIKVDKSIPRFPLNETFYENKHPVLAKIQYLCYKIYGQEYAAGDTVMEKPLYAPFNDVHLNYYLLRRKSGMSTTIKEITSVGKKTIMEEIRIGKWVTYNTDHTIKSVEYYNDGQLISADK